MDTALLYSILSQPTAPFREAHVVRAVTAYLSERGVAHFLDPVGNIVVGASSEAEYRKILAEPSAEPVRLYIAHMDHPGFHGERWISRDLLAVTWHGGSPKKHLVGAPVWLADSGEARGRGKIVSVKLGKGGRGIQSAKVKTSGVDRESFPDPRSLFGAFQFKKPYWKVGDRIYTKAADDLVGVATIVSLAAARARTEAGPAFLGLLTRAEEVGFIGCIGHLELGWLEGRRRPLVCVSLETSRTLPGAVPGKGPVVRLGDRATTFDPGGTQLFTQLALATLGKKFQRRIMDGGTCEGTAATVFGLPTIAVSIPLGNYHNEAFEGGPESRGKEGPGPEFVHLSDAKGMYRLCEALLAAELPWKDPWAKRRAQYRESFSKSKALLNER
jgi:putative aminopeptidase FrvX